MAKTRKTNRKVTPSTAALTTLPTIEKALADVVRFQIRATVGLIVRIILLAVLTTLLRKQNATWETAAPLLQAGAVVLAVWPWFTTQGRLWAGRIDLGRRYGDAGRFADAAQLLAPLARAAARVFDAQRTGTFQLARALHEQQQNNLARPLLEVVARDAPPNSAIREQSAALLRTLV